MKLSVSPSTVVSIAMVGGVIFAYEKIKAIFSTQASAQAFATAHPNLAALAISLGFKTPGGLAPDVTGASGAKAAATAQLESEGLPTTPGNVAATESGSNEIPAAGSTSQAYYDVALQQYAYVNNFDTSLDAQGSTGWPWVSYAAWLNAGTPALPSAALVSVDGNGQFHNQYE